MSGGMFVKEPSSVMIDGRRMAFDEVCPPYPKGTVLLLTGLGSKRLGWFKQITVFGQHYRTIALDHRDSGDSDPVHKPYKIDDLADDVAAVLTKLDIQHAHLVGISLGGFVALHVALRHSRLVDKLILTSTSAGGTVHVPPGLAMLAILARRDQKIESGELARRNYTRLMAPGFAAKHPEDLEIIAEIARYRPPTLEAYFRQLHAGTTHDVSRQLHHIQQPVLVIHGAVDPLVPVVNGLYLAHRIKGAKLILYPDTGHIPNIERAEAYNHDVLAFLGL